jgi:hypothetical protein
MTRVMQVLYVTMSVWLIFASAGRIALMLNGGQDLDVLPFIGGGMGIAAIILYGITWDRGHR